ncbi:hypothetical protein BDF22DRAFT_682913 [Syncephalis plumigaleata]|nr:hypothetical protein BDF22DRAFT_682913 [Syncephalis plumigaleata]
MSNSSKATTVASHHERRRQPLPLVDWGAYTDASSHWRGPSMDDHHHHHTSSKLKRGTWHFGKRQVESNTDDVAPIEVPLSICVFDKPKPTSDTITTTDDESGNASMSSCESDSTDEQNSSGSLLTPADESVESVLPYVQTAMALNAPIPLKHDNSATTTATTATTTVGSTKGGSYYGSRPAPQPLARRAHSSPSPGWFDVMTRGLFWVPFLKSSTTISSQITSSASTSTGSVHENDDTCSDHTEDNVNYNEESYYHDGEDMADISLPLVELQSM